MTATDLYKGLRLDKKPLPPSSYLFSVIKRYLGDRPSFARKEFIAPIANYAELKRSQSMGTSRKEDFLRIKDKTEMDLLDACKALVYEQSRPIERAFIEEEILENLLQEIRALVSEGKHGEPMRLIADFLDEKYSIYTPEVARRRKFYRQSITAMGDHKDMLESRLVEYLLSLPDRLKLESWFLKKNRWDGALEETVQLCIDNKLEAAFSKVEALAPPEGRMHREAIWLSHSYERLKHHERMGFIQIDTYYEMRATLVEEAVGFLMRQAGMSSLE
jgi:hypothetical protein